MQTSSAAVASNQYVELDLQSFDGLQFAVQEITPTGAESIGDWVEWLVRPADLSAGEYVEAVQSVGLAVEFDQAVLYAAAHWLQFQPPTTRLSVNVFAKSISDIGFADFVDDLILTSDLFPNQLCFEITEHHEIDNLTAATGFAKHVRNLGASVALDDIGTGNMHVGLLAPLQLVDFVKIDRSWVTPALECYRHKETLDALVKFANRMNIQVILEGIETADHMQLVAEYHADYYQGFIDGIPKLVGNKDHTHCKGLAEAI